MESNKTNQIGSSFAIVVIVGVVAIAGIYFYKNMVKEINHDASAEDMAHEQTYDEHGHSHGEHDAEPTRELASVEILSDSTDIDAIAADLDRTLEEDVDISFIDDIDEQLLDFDELDTIDFDL